MPVARVVIQRALTRPRGLGRRRGGGVGGADLEARARRAGARRGTRAWVPPRVTRARARAAGGGPACDVEQDMVLVGVCVGGDPARALFARFSRSVFINSRLISAPFKMPTFQSLFTQKRVNVRASR